MVQENNWFQSQTIEHETPPAVTETASSQPLATDEVDVDIESVHGSEEDDSDGPNLAVGDI